MTRFLAWFALIFGCLYFLLPLVGMAEFSLKMRRGEYSFDAYARVFEDPTFWATFSYSLAMAGATIVVLPAPGGATSTAFRPLRSAAFSSSKTDSIGSVTQP